MSIIGYFRNIQSRPTATLYELPTGGVPPSEDIILLEVGGPSDGILLENNSGKILIE